MLGIGGEYLMHNNMSRCIDINSQYCPCLLAETNNCVFCSHLSGQSSCDCNWAGVCVLYEKHWQRKKKHNRGEDDTIRCEEETEYTIVEQVNENTYILEFSVSSELSLALTKTGSFVFLRRPRDPYFYHFPVGIMKVIGNKIYVAIEAIGPKSSRIVTGNDKTLLVRGPYYNGVLGQPWIDNIKDGRILLVAGGMGQAPALPLVTKLVENGNSVTAIVAPGHTGAIYIESDLNDLGVEVLKVPSMRRVGLGLISNSISEYDLIVSSGPDEQHYGVIDAMQALNINKPMAATNNATMCCGEGICGSCLKETHDNRFIRTCKVQADFRELVRD